MNFREKAAGLFANKRGRSFRSLSSPRKRGSSPQVAADAKKFMSPRTRLFLDSRLRGNDSNPADSDYQPILPCCCDANGREPPVNIATPKHFRANRTLHRPAVGKCSHILPTATLARPYASIPPASSASAGSRIFCAMRPEFSRIACSIRSAMMGLLFRKFFAFSRPCPSLWLS